MNKRELKQFLRIARNYNYELIYTSELGYYHFIDYDHDDTIKIVKDNFHICMTVLIEDIRNKAIKTGIIK